MALDWKKLALLQYALNPSGVPAALGLDASGDLRVVDDQAQALLQRVVDALGEDSGSTLNSLLTVLSQIDFATSANQDTAQAVYDRIIATLGEASGASVLAVLQSIDSKDFATETTLQSIDIELATQQKDALTNTQLRAADVEVNDDVAQGKLDTVNTNLGTDGAAPPSIPGTGVRGWLRAIWDKIKPNADIDPLNNFTGTLAPGASFTGQWVEIGDYTGIRSVADVDTAGAEVTGTIEFSPDGSTVLTRLTRSGVIPGPFTVNSVITPAASYYRVKATNTGSVTTGYLIQVHLQRNPSRAPSVPLGFPITDESLADTVRAALTGKKETTGAWVPSQFSNDGHLIVALGNRISQTNGRSHKEVNVINPTANSILYTVPAGFNYHVHSTRVFGANSSTSARLLAYLRDGAAGDVKGGIAIEQSTTGLGGIIKVGNEGGTHPEPMVFNTNVYWQVVSGGFSGAVILVGYLEPV